jgi:hypothetical protein
MAGLVPAIHVLLCSQDVDARHKAGHDVEEAVQAAKINLAPHIAVRLRIAAESVPSSR